MSDRALHISGLTFEAGGARRVDLPELRLSETGMSVIMGPNGAGKSLVLRLIHGLIVPTAGNIRQGSRPLDDPLRKRQALVFQTPVLLRRSARANLEFVLKARGLPIARAAQLLAQVGLLDHAQRPARALSGGEQQRLAIARALATEPDTLFLDEPTASLDPAATLAIERILKEIQAAGVKIVLVTHDIHQAQRMGGEVIFLANGKLIEQGPSEVFFTKPKTETARAYLDGRISALLEV